MELVNLQAPSLVFEPIHRALFGVDPRALIGEYRAALAQAGLDAGEGDDLVAFDGAGHTWRFRSDEHPLGRLQGFLDGKEGFIYHVLSSFWYRFVVDAKIYEYEHGKPFEELKAY